MKNLQYTLLILSIVFIIFGVMFYNKNKAFEVKFELFKKDGDYEVRVYKNLLLIEVEQKGERSKSGNLAFPFLFNYIKSNNIPMTIPVFQEPVDFEINIDTMSDKEKFWKMQFIISDGYLNDLNLENAPKASSKEVKIISKKDKKYLCLKFSGNPNNANILKKVSEMKDFLEKNKQSFKVTENSNMIIAVYNAPWALPFLKRNEILIEIQ